MFFAPPPSLHELRRSRGRFVRSLLCYFGQVRLLPRAHRRLRPPAFPTRSRPRLVRTAMEISRFPVEGFCACQGLRRRGAGSYLAITTRTISPSVGRKTSAPRTCLTPLNTWPYALPYQRIRLQPHDHTRMARGRCSSLRLHRDGLARLPSAGLPAHPPTASKADVFLFFMSCLDPSEVIE